MCLEGRKAPSAALHLNSCPATQRNPSDQLARYGMANYRRNFLAGGSYFFTVNLADRRLTLSNDHIDL